MYVDTFKEPRYLVQVVPTALAFLCPCSDAVIIHLGGKSPFYPTSCRSDSSLALTHQILKVKPKAITGPFWVEELRIQGPPSCFIPLLSLPANKAYQAFPFS